MSRPGAVVNRSGVSPQFPTQLHPPEFWEQLGRTIATFGFLEETLAKAIFASTATREYSEEAVQEALGKWPDQLQRALSDTLYPLAEVYGKAVREHQDSNFKNVGDFIDDIKKAAEVRNALCHGSWRSPDTSGRSALFYFSKKDGRFDSKIDTAWLRQVQAHVIDLICAVIS